VFPWPGFPATRPGKVREMKRAAAVRILTISMMCVLMAGAAFAIDVELRHPIYPFLERCELKGLLEHPLSGARPFTRRMVAALLKEAHVNRDRLNRIERQQLSYFLFEFGDDLPPELRSDLDRERDHFSFEKRGSSTPWKQLALYKDPRYIYSTRGENYLVTFNPNLEIGFDLLSSDTLSGNLSRMATGLAVMGYYGDFGLLAIARDTHFTGKTALADPRRYPVRYFADARDPNGFEFDESEAAISYDIPHIRVTFGRGQNKWDWGEAGSLGLSDQATSYTQLRYRLTFQPLEVTGIHARLRQLPPYITGRDTLDNGDVREHYAEKWMVGHHYQVNLFPWFQLGLWDLLVYGNRGLEFDYIPPMSFLWSMEHYAHDQDNVMLGLDGRFLPGWRSEIYFQWFLDELQFSKLGSDWWGNKHGIQLGVRQVDALTIPNSSLAIEYYRIRPYVYSHFVPYNNATHYGQSLGFGLPPNSDMLFASWQQQLKRSLALWIEGRFIRQGSTPASGRNVGAEIERIRALDDPEQAKFLDGDLHSIRDVRLGATLEIGYQLFLKGSIRLEWNQVEPEVGPVHTLQSIALFASLSWHPARWR